MRPWMLLVVGSLVLTAVVIAVVAHSGSSTATGGRTTPAKGSVWKDPEGNVCAETDAHFGDHWPTSGLNPNRVWCPASVPKAQLVPRERSRWVVRDLGTLGGGQDSHAVAINERGQVVGVSSAKDTYENGDHVAHAFLWQKGRMTDLGTLPGSQTSTAAAINDRADVIGDSPRPTGGVRSFVWQKGKLTSFGDGTIAAALNDRGQIVVDGPHPFLWQDGRRTPLGQWASRVFAINERGQVVGSKFTNGQRHAFLWENGRLTDLGALGGGTHDPVAINDRSQVIGNAGVATGRVPFLWENGRMRNLGTLGGSKAEVSAINNRGQIIGTSYTAAGHQHAFLWQNGKMRDLGTLGGASSGAGAINERGQIVGSSYPPSGPQGWASPLAFVWENGKMTRLPVLPGCTGSGAGDISEQGQIVGSCRIGIHEHAVLWTLRSG